MKAMGSEWNRDNKHRIYFDLRALYGLRTEHYKTGNISSATLRGEPISNGRARDLGTTLDFAKVFYDINTDEFGAGGHTSDEMFDAIVEEIERQLAEA